MKKYAIILAAGKGTRMNSNLPKCAVNFLGKPIIERIVNTCLENNFDDIIVVVGEKKEIIKNILKNKVTYINQHEQLGTAHAVLCCKEYFNNKDGICVIIPGDMPLIDNRTIYKLIKVHNEAKSSFTFVSTIILENNNYGRIYREEGIIKKIIEYKSLTESQKNIKEVNSGLYCANIAELFKELTNVKMNPTTNEYYLTDLVELFANKKDVNCYFFKDNNNLLGVNTLEELRKVEEKFINNKKEQ